MITREIAYENSRCFSTLLAAGDTKREMKPRGVGGGVLQRILDRGVPRRFVNPNPTFGLRKRRLVPFLRPKAEK